MILKAGTYRFNDEITPLDKNITIEEFNGDEPMHPLPFYCISNPNIVFDNLRCCSINIDDAIEQDGVTYDASIHKTEMGYIIKQINNYWYAYEKGSMSISHNGEVVESGTYNGWCDGQPPYPSDITDYQTHTIIEDTEVTDDFGTWYKANTNYNEVNPTETPIATITYNGETIAQLNAGETVILKCEGLPMETDIIVKVNE